MAQRLRHLDEQQTIARRVWVTTQRYVYSTTLGLFTTDGSANSQTLIKGATAGGLTTLGFALGYPMAELPDGAVVFGANGNDGSNVLQVIEGIQVWVTDGTPGGTTMLTALPDINGGQPNDTAAATNFVTAGSKVYFEYADGAGDYFLYSTDGTVAGTNQLLEPVLSDSVGPGDGAAIGSSYVFADASGAYNGLYITNGSGGNETLLKATSAGGLNNLGFLPGTQMAALPDGKVVFGANGNDGSNVLQVIEGIQVWVTDGTPGGTTMLTALPDINGGQPNDTAAATNFVTAGSKVYFEYADGAGDTFLYSTDGTVAGTNQILASVLSDSVGPGDGAAIGSSYVFADASGAYNGLYITNGSGGNATLIKATTAGGPTTLGFLPGTQMAALPGGKVVFGANGNDGSNVFQVIQGIQVWVTDGTPGGTTMLTAMPDINGGQPNDTAAATNFVTAGNQVLFDYNDGAGDTFLYSTDGTAAGTTEIGQVDANSVGPGDGASPLACFAAGTRIATPRGEIAVEALAPGDLVLTASGAARPIVWIGHRRVNCQHHPQPKQVWPVRIAADAFGPGQPCRDLFLSPDHAVFDDDVLIPIRYLIDGTSIAQVQRPEVTYYHVELSSHDVVLAEGLPTESYLDTGDRSNFANGGGTVSLFANFGAYVREALAYAPLIVTGPRLEALRRKLMDRARLQRRQPGREGTRRAS